MFSRRRMSAALIGLILLAVGGWWVKGAIAVDESGPGPGNLPGAGSGLPVSTLSSLPPEAGQMWTLIGRGGPFPYPDSDGVTFGNKEKLLPQEPPGYYRAYTVETPGSEQLGPRRLVTGQQDEVYYTGDHYRSFVVVDPRR